MVRKNKFSILLALIILYLSLSDSDTFDRFSVIDLPFIDKLVHSAMYFSLMLVLIFENRGWLEKPVRWLFISSIPLMYGSIIELLQATLTVSREGDFIDILFNLSGIVLAIFFWFAIRRISQNQLK
jgi:hypothetical protein